MTKTAGHQIFPKSVARMQRAAGKQLLCIEPPRSRPQGYRKVNGMDVRIVPTLSALTLFATCLCARAETFDDLWLTRIKPPPYGGVATEFDDAIAADGKRLRPYRDLVCAHMLEQIGQRLRVTNVANGKSVVCTVADRGPNRRAAKSI